MGHPATQARVAARVAEEVDDLGQVGLGFVDPGHVVERDRDLLRVHPPSHRTPEVPEPAQAPTTTSGGAASQEPEQPHEQYGRPEAEQEVGQQRRAGARRLSIDLDAVRAEHLGELG